MAHTRLWSSYEAKPAGSDNANTGDDEIRAGKVDVRERMVMDHEWDVSTTADGYHLQATLKDRTNDLSAIAGYGRVYGKTVNSIVELCYIDSAGTVKQITTNGQLNMNASRHMITRGFGLTYKDADEIYVEPGTLYHNITEVNTTARTTLASGTDSNWLDGSKPASLASIWVYVYSDASGNIKLEETAPAYADTSGNTVGKLIYHLETSTYWRWIGQWPTDSSGNFINGSYPGDWFRYDVKQIVVNAGTATSFTAASCSAYIPSTSTLGDFTLQADGVNNTGGGIRPTGSAESDGIVRVKGTQFVDSSAQTRGNGLCRTNSSQSIDYKKDGDTSLSVWVVGYYCPRN